MSSAPNLGAAGISASVREELAVDWAVVRKLTGANQLGGVVGAAYVSYAAPAGFLNLPLVLAYSVLGQFLGELMWPGKKLPIGFMMEESVGRLSWKDYCLVDEGANARNRVAHHAELQPDASCFKYIAAVEAELLGWGVIDG